MIRSEPTGRLKTYIKTFMKSMGHASVNLTQERVRHFMFHRVHLNPFSKRGAGSV